MPQTPLHERFRRMYIFFMIMWDFLTPLNDLKELCNQFDLDMWILQEIRTTHYLWGCSPVPKLGNINLAWEYAQSLADHHCFINMLCVSPDVFDVILSFIHDNPVFYNNSNNPQAPVQTQLAVILYCLGQYGNGASLEDVMQTAGILEGSVENYTNHCIDAIEDLHNIFVWPLMGGEGSREEMDGQAS